MRSITLRPLHILDIDKLKLVRDTPPSQPKPACLVAGSKKRKLDTTGTALGSNAQAGTRPSGSDAKKQKKAGTRGSARAEEIEEEKRIESLLMVPARRNGTSASSQARISTKTVKTSVK